MPKSSAKKICIIDDDDAVRDSMSALLISYGFDICSYDSALSFLADRSETAGNCGCLLVDLHMPAMDGLEFLELLQSQQVRVPMILVTGRSDSALKERTRKAGILTLDKPVSEAKLLNSIEQATVNT